MSFIDNIKEKAKQDIKTIVLPESNDLRILRGAEIVLKEGFANIILIGNEQDIYLAANNNNIDLTGATIVDPTNSEKLDFYAEKLYDLRKEKGMTLDEAKNILLSNSRYFACMMVKLGDADGYVSGAANPTSDTLRPALQIIKGAPGVDTVSAFFVMCLPDNKWGDNGNYIYADCGMVEDPDEKQLADIAIVSAESYKELINPDGIPLVAMLSYSTKGSAHSELTDKVINATNIVHEKKPDLLVDGEMQLDAAIIPEIGEKKAPESKVSGKANILIFPDLNAGNIGYKLTERFGNAKAYGPLIQGLDLAVNDLSRGCSAEDVAGVVAITAVQAHNKQNKN